MSHSVSRSVSRSVSHSMSHPVSPFVSHSAPYSVSLSIEKAEIHDLDEMALSDDEVGTFDRMSTISLSQKI